MKQSFFRLAKKISLRSPSRYKLGALISKKNCIISVGWNNMNKTHSKANSSHRYLHAEIHALLGTDYEETKGGTLYTYRETLNGDIAQSRPCSSCLEAIKLSGIKEICYSTYEGFIKEKV
jgi:deoxycytidylate deaminase